MPKLIIKRTSEWSNRMRKIGIYLDGVKLDVISNGETKEFEVNQGIHSLKSRIDWCGSPTINLDIKEGETHRIDLTSNNSNKWVSLITAVACIAYLTFGRTYDLNPLPFMVFVVPGFLYFVNSFTFGRNKYLKMKIG